MGMVTTDVCAGNKWAHWRIVSTLFLYLCTCMLLHLAERQGLESWVCAGHQGCWGNMSAVRCLQIMTKIGGTCLITIGVWCTIELIVQFGKYRHVCHMGSGTCIPQL